MNLYPVYLEYKKQVEELRKSIEKIARDKHHLVEIVETQKATIEALKKENEDLRACIKAMGERRDPFH